MPRLVVKTGETLCSLELKAGINRLGRLDHNDFPINHPTVSSTHCEVLLEGEAVTVRDCGSTNGTFINGERIREAPLPLGGRLRLGEVELELQPPVPTVAIPHVDFRAPPPPPRLPDGSAPCLNHPERRAAYECSQCHKTFCRACIHELHRVGGRSMTFCPACSGRCVFLGPVEKPRKKSIFDFLRAFKRTVRLPSRRRH